MNDPAPVSTSCAWKFFVCLRKFWWIPLITLVLSIGTTVALFLLTPPMFVATGSLWETARIRLEGEAAFTEDRNIFLGTQSQLLRSDMMRDLTLNRMKAVGANAIINDETGKPIPVDIQVFASSNSSIYTIQARSGNPAFTPAYLNALMEQYLEYRKNIKQAVSTSTLASIAEQVQRYERDMKTAQAALAEYQRTNNFATLQEEASIEAAHLVKLKTDLADNQLEAMILDRSSLSEAETAQRQKLQIRIDVTQKFIAQWETNVAAANNIIASADGLKEEVARNQELYERLSKLLQNLQVSRNIDTENLAILQQAKSATRAYADFKSKLVRSGIFGLVLGLGIVVLLGWYRARRRNVT